MKIVSALLLGVVAVCAAACGGEEAATSEGEMVTATMHQFECETLVPYEGGVRHSMAFGIRALERPAELALVGDEDGAITVFPEGSSLATLDLGATARAEHGKIVVRGGGESGVELAIDTRDRYSRGVLRRAGESEVPVACTVTEKTPRYTLAATHLLGRYEGSDFCKGGPTACEWADVAELAPGKWQIAFGAGEYTPGYVARVWQRNGVLLFSTGDRYGYDGPDNDDCQDPGCLNLLKITGVIYPRKVDGQWVPTIKAHVTIDFPHPDEREAPRGEHRFVTRMSQLQD